MRNTGPSASVLALVKARDGDLCLRCQVARAESTHHRVGRGMGGSRRLDINGPAALARLCGDGVRGCHGWLTGHPAEAFHTGWSIRRSDPRPASKIPLYDLHGCELYLTDDGQALYTSSAGFFPADPIDFSPPF